MITQECISRNIYLADDDDDDSMFFEEAIKEVCNDSTLINGKRWIGINEYFA
jgi:hypothetical protein